MSLSKRRRPTLECMVPAKLLGRRESYLTGPGAAAQWEADADTHG
jgi:hypothetical protein